MYIQLQLVNISMHTKFHISMAKNARTNQVFVSMSMSSKNMQPPNREISSNKRFSNFPMISTPRSDFSTIIFASTTLGSGSGRRDKESENRWIMLATTGEPENFWLKVKVADSNFWASLLDEDIAAAGYQTGSEGTGMGWRRPPTWNFWPSYAYLYLFEGMEGDHTKGFLTYTL